MRAGRKDILPGCTWPTFEAGKREHRRNGAAATFFVTLRAAARGGLSRDRHDVADFDVATIVGYDVLTEDRFSLRVSSELGEGS